MPYSPVVAGLSLVLMLAGCEQRASLPPRTTTAPRLSGTDALAYERGRRREIELTRAAIDLVRRATTVDQRTVMEAAADRDRIQSEAARAAGLTATEYGRLVLRVDSALVADSRSSTDPSVQRLDSLRVSLVVLRSRLAAEMSQPFHPGPAASRRTP